MNCYIDQIEKHNAEGIDFVPIMIPKEEAMNHIIESYTKEEFKDVKYVPKTNYLFWKMIDGKKTYLE